MDKTEKSIFIKIKSVLEEKNGNITVDDYAEYKFKKDRQIHKAIWITLNKDFPKKLIVNFLKELSENEKISIVIFKVQSSSHVAYIKILKGLVVITKNLQTCSMSDLQKEVIPEDKIQRVLNSLYKTKTKSKETVRIRRRKGKASANGHS